MFPITVKQFTTASSLSSVPYFQPLKLPILFTTEPTPSPINHQQPHPPEPIAKHPPCYRQQPTEDCPPQATAPPPSTPRPNHHTFRPTAIHPLSATTNAPSGTTAPSHCFAQHHRFKSQPPHGTQTSFTPHCPKPPSCTAPPTTTPLSVFLPVSLQPVQHCFSYPINIENIDHFSPTRGQIVVPPLSNLAVVSSCHSRPYWKSRHELHPHPNSCSH